MEIKKGCVVAMHYKLTNDQGEILDSSEGREPLKFLHGAGNIISGLDNAMVGKSIGDSFTVTVEPEEAYGVHHEQMIQTVPREAFQGIDDIQIGMKFNAETQQGPVAVTVTEVTEGMITIDGNHELAGVRLTFDVTIEDVRAATEDEIAHNHAH